MTETVIKALNEAVEVDVTVDKTSDVAIEVPFELFDEFKWLEEVESKESLDWVRANNVVNDSQSFKTLKQKICEVLDSNEKIPYVDKGPDGFYYNLWKDKTNKLGVWRRTTPSKYEKSNTLWETVLDVDKLSEQEGKTWVWHGVKFLHASHKENYRCLITLSRGGSDADETREFDLNTKNWVKSINGFFRPESKGGLTWKDRDTVYVYTDFDNNLNNGLDISLNKSPDKSPDNSFDKSPDNSLDKGEKGDKEKEEKEENEKTSSSLTDSGYPRIVKEWKRGQSLKDARTIYEGKKTDMYISASYSKSCNMSFVSRMIAFYNDELYVLNDDYSLTLLDVPNSANKEVHNGFLFLELRKDWKTFVAGSLLAIRLTHLIELAKNTDTDKRVEDKCSVLFSPISSNVSLSSFTFTKNYVVMNLLDNVKSKIVLAHLSNYPVKDLTKVKHSSVNVFTNELSEDLTNVWVKKEFECDVGLSSIIVTPVDSDDEDSFFLTVTDFLTPSTLSLVWLSTPSALSTIPSSGQIIEPIVKKLKSLPSFFDASNHTIEQLWATSTDGTKVPYFCVRPKDIVYDSMNPTVLYGYGGFEVSMLPYYAANVGIGWLNPPISPDETSVDFINDNKNKRKGVFVVANIRGGGEFGPAWHQAALKSNRHRAYEDFASVARDLVSRKITQPKLLGCNGGSNGGLLTGNMLMQYPDLFGAVVIQVPLLDMKRYNKLLAGASWMAEYGNPDLPEEWEFLKTFSPYHLLQENPNNKLPSILITTSTRDDRVHPGHARKMTALLLKLNKDVTYYENIEGGHGGAANSEQQAHMNALIYCFLQKKLTKVRQ